MTGPVPHTKFSTEMFEPKLRREAWIEGMKSMHDVSPIDTGKPEFNGSVDVWDVDGLIFGIVANDAQIMDHRRSKHNRSGDHDYLFTAIYRKGGARALHDGKPVQIGSDGVNIIDYSRDRRSVSPASVIEGIIVPYNAVGFEPGKHSGSIVLPYDTPAGYILSRLSAMIYERLPTSDLKQAKTMARIFTGTLRSLISGDADEVARDQAVSARRAVMQQFIIDNIHDLSLDVATLCEKFGVSRATVFRDFEPGGIQHFMMTHRLDRALSDIAFGPAIRGRIALIANKWGFSSPAHFSRAFRENFGFSPSDAVGVGRGFSAEPTRAIDIDDDWMVWRKQ